jgi:hypothetical protein
VNKVFFFLKSEMEQDFSLSFSLFEMKRSFHGSSPKNSFSPLNVKVGTSLSLLNFFSFSFLSCSSVASTTITSVSPNQSKIEILFFCSLQILHFILSTSLGGNFQTKHNQPPPKKLSQSHSQKGIINSTHFF